MAAGSPSPTYIQSLNPSDATPVFTRSHAQGAIQGVHGIDCDLYHPWSVRSFANSNPLAVALTDETGAHLSVQSVHVTNDLTVTAGSLGVSQLGAPWSVTGSTQVTQGTDPWTIQGSVSGTVVASIAGTLAVTVTGSVEASQAGAPWSVTGSTQVTQGTDPWTVAGSAQVRGAAAHDAAFAGEPVAAGAYAIPADTSSITAVGSGDATRLLADEEGRLRVKVDSGALDVAQSGTWTVQQGGAPWSVVGSTDVTLQGSQFHFLVGSSGDVAAVSSWGTGPAVHVLVVSQAAGAGATVDSVFATQVGSWQVGVTGPGGTQLVGVASWGPGAALQVTVVSMDVGAGATVDSVWASGVAAHDEAFAGNPVPTGAYAIPADTASIAAVGSGDATRLLADEEGRLRVKVDSGVLDVAQSGTWTVQQGGAPWTTTTTATIVHGDSLSVAQMGGPWSVTGSTEATLLATSGTDAGQLTATSFADGRLLRVDVVQAAAVTGTVTANQGGAPWSVVGSVDITLADSLGVAQMGAPWTVTGSVDITLADSLTVYQGAAPWTMTGSVEASVATGTRRYKHIADAVTSALAFPFDGTTAQVASSTAAGSNTLWLATDVFTGDLAGFAVMLTSSGEAQGTVRTVAGWSSADSLIIAVDSPWVASEVPASGQTYTLGLDCRNKRTLTMRTEAASSTATGMWVALGKWDVQYVGSAVQPAPAFERQRLIDVLPFSFHVVTASFWQCEEKTADVTGATLVKAYVTSVAPQNFSMWGDVV